MGLYSSISGALSVKGLISGLKGGVDPLLASANSQLKGAFGDSAIGNLAADTTTTMASNAASNLANKYIPSAVQRAAQKGLGIAENVANGDYQDAGVDILEEALSSLGIASGSSRINDAQLNKKTSLLGGLSARDAMKMYREISAIQFSRKNLFILEVSNDRMSSSSLSIEVKRSSFVFSL